MDLSAVGSSVLFFAASARRGYSGIPPPGTMMTCGKTGNEGSFPTSCHRLVLFSINMRKS